MDTSTNSKAGNEQSSKAGDEQSSKASDELNSKPDDELNSKDTSKHSSASAASTQAGSSSVSVFANALKNCLMGTASKSCIAFWCFFWASVILASACYFQDHGPLYPARIRQELKFKGVDLPAIQRIFVADMHKYKFSKRLLHSGKLVMLADSKPIAELMSLDKTSNQDLPGFGQYTFREHYFMYAPNQGISPVTDGKTYELYYPPEVPTPLKVLSILALTLAVAGAVLGSFGKRFSDPAPDGDKLISAESRTLDDSSNSESVNSSDIAGTDASNEQNKQLTGQEKFSTRFLTHTFLAALVLALGIYFSTGGLTPLNLFGNSVVKAGVPYFMNSDHNLHRAIFDFLDGHPASGPANMLLRRILFPTLSYPFMKTMGFEIGGLIGSCLVNFSAPILFGFYCAKRYGERAGIVVLWLLSTYPGIAYFAGQPYVYSFIIPGTLAMMALLSELERSSKIRTVICLSLALGVLNLGYDLMVFFMPTVLGVLATQKRFKQALIAVPATMAPTLVWVASLWTFGPHDALVNANTSVYANGIMAYSTLKNPAVLQATLLGLPAVLLLGVKLYFMSTFYFLPALAAISLALGRFTKTTRLLRCELFVLLTALAIFLFANCAPNYLHSGFSAGSEWQLKGDQFARLYQPIFAVFLSYIAREWMQIRNISIVPASLLIVATVLTVLANGLVVFGPILNNPFCVSSRAYHDFYMQAPEPLMQRTLQIFGRRPIGFFNPAEALKSCNPSGQIK